MNMRYWKRLGWRRTVAHLEAVSGERDTLRTQLASATAELATLRTEGKRLRDWLRFLHVAKARQYSTYEERLCPLNGEDVARFVGQALGGAEPPKEDTWIR